MPVSYLSQYCKRRLTRITSQLTNLKILVYTFHDEQAVTVAPLRTFARKYSNIDFSLRILPLKDDELVLSEMYKKWGVTDFVLEITCREERPKSAKSGFVTE